MDLLERNIYPDVNTHETTSRRLVAATAVLFATAVLGPLLVGPSVGPYQAFWFRLYLPLYATGFGWVLWRNRIAVARIHHSIPIAVWLLATFGLYVALSVVWTATLGEAISGLFIILSGLFISGAVFATATGEQTLLIYLLVVFALVVFGEITAIVEIFTGAHFHPARLAGEISPNKVRIGVDMASAWFGNRNNFVFFLGLASGPLFAFALNSATGGNSVLRLSYLTSVVLALLLAWANGAQTGLVMIAVSLGAVITLTRGRHYIRIQSWTPLRRGAAVTTGLIFLAALAAVFIIVFVPNPFAVKQESFWSRWQLGIAAIELLVHSNGFGVGVGNFPPAVEALSVPTDGKLSPHNWLFYLFGEFGVVGTGLFLAAYARILYDLFVNALTTDDTISLGLFATMFSLPIGALGPSNALHMHALWLFVGLAAAAAYRTRSSA